MVKLPQTSPITGQPVPSYYLHASDAYFRDTKGRAILLRGVNLSGSAKAPLGHSTFDDPETFWSDAEAGGSSFINQPLNLLDDSADVHLSRLKAWGFNCFRFVFTWEALEHAGPGKYDYEYMDYVVSVLRRIKSFGFRVFMDPHQDLFSRFTGGSGAPYWVLPACGIDHRNISATQASIIQCEWPTPEKPDPQSFPAMIWATNYTRLAAATLSVFFFAGRHLAPKCILDGENVQDWLQGHFIRACGELCKKVVEAGDLVEECVIGWDSMNEPNGSYIGLDAINVLPDQWPLKKGPMPTPLQSMKLGMGQAQTVQHWVFGGLGPKRQKDVVVDPQGRSLWLTKEEDGVRGGKKWGFERGESWPLGTCPWAAHGVWDIETGEVLHGDYFKYFRSDTPEEPQRPTDFVDDYWLPFFRTYAKTIRSIHKEAIIFIQPPVFEPPPKGMTEEDLMQRACTSQHFYDGLTLITKHWNWFNADAVGLLRGKYPGVLFSLKVGLKAIRQGMRDQLGYLREDTLTVLGKYPTLIGEIGIPYDMDDRKTYYGDSKGNGIGDYSQQATALDASLNACDGLNMLSFTAWNYVANNSHKCGDHWNGEDFSFWSQDDIKYANLPPSLEGVRSNSSAQSRSADGTSDNATLAIGGQEIDAGLLSPSPALTRTNSGVSVLDSVAPMTSSSHFPAITNGSRCAQAFCRPYPIATTGTPYELNFDIKSSELSYQLDLDQDDLELLEKDPDLATEIFLPFLHYASDSLAGAASGNVSDSGRSQPSSRSRRESMRKQSLTPLTSSSASQSQDSLPIQSIDSDASRASRRGGMAPYLSPSSESTGSSLSLKSVTTSSNTKSKLEKARNGNGGLPSNVADKFTYSLEVSASAGKWEVTPGTQILRWTLAGASPGRHKLTLKRKGGPIQFHQSGSAFEMLVEHATQALFSVKA